MLETSGTTYCRFRPLRAKCWMSVLHRFSLLWLGVALTAACVQDPAPISPAVWSPSDYVWRLTSAQDGEPLRLSETGLYQDVATQRLHGAAIEFSPTYPLWSDGSQK